MLENNSFSELSKIGFVYDFQLIDINGNVKDSWSVHNLVPTVGMNYILSTAFAGGAAASAWYIGLFSDNYTPLVTDTSATAAYSTNEYTGYTNATRGALTAGAITTGTWSNTAAPFDFTFNTTGTIYGAFLSSTSTKTGATGTLASAARFSASKTAGSGEILRVTAGITLSN